MGKAEYKKVNAPTQNANVTLNSFRCACLTVGQNGTIPLLLHSTHPSHHNAHIIYHESRVVSSWSHFIPSCDKLTPTLCHPAKCMGGMLSKQDQANANNLSLFVVMYGEVCTNHKRTPPAFSQSRVGSFFSGHRL